MVHYFHLLLQLCPHLQRRRLLRGRLGLRRCLSLLQSGEGLRSLSDSQGHQVGVGLTCWALDIADA